MFLLTTKDSEIERHNEEDIHDIFLEAITYQRSSGDVRHSIAAWKAEGAGSSTAWRKSFDRN
ncbi:unnamed protein product [Heligmosomoides polygyrus]|uniref:DUF2934 domain-containing protein n=1 Tax=Heligmosomoides polygyrus TaxID=6339 RepID=A0A183FBV1_HELPZ|nr:unnamed protein product [Heligmosomoides polygyrus]